MAPSATTATALQNLPHALRSKGPRNCCEQILRPFWEAVETGLLCLPGPFFGPGQGRHLRLAFANAEPARIAEIPGRLQATRLATSSSV
jgi:aspartate/methionine/tyrosine aminotransferase